MWPANPHGNLCRFRVGTAVADAALLRFVCLQQPEHMSLFPGAFLQHLMPALCQVISDSSSHSDTRFFCLRMMSDVLAIYLTNPDMYSAALVQPQQQTRQVGDVGTGVAEVTQALDMLLRKHVVPLVPVLLQQEEPMPLYALKVSSCWSSADPQLDW